MSTFINLGIQEKTVHILQDQGVTEPTPIQLEAIPHLLKGKDVLGQAQTGTGKTLAFILPILEMVKPNDSHIQSLIIAPTRELALQITTEVKKLTDQLEEYSVLAVYGGQDVEQQLKKLKGSVHIVIATPGRLLDHLRRETIDLTHVSMLVLDEADQMLHMGFLNEVESIIQNTPDTRQTMLFSATMPPEIRKLAHRYMKEPVDVHVKSTGITVQEIGQLVIETTDRAKMATLFHLIDQYRPFLAIIFCRTKRRVSKLNEQLQTHGYQSDELHGDLSQAKRERVMKNFREAKIQLLVATDVAARGLDVEGVTHVFNYDIPQDVESYVHRIGRTGRAGGEGLAITLAAQKDRNYLELIEKGIGMKLDKKSMVLPKREINERDIEEDRSSKPRRFARSNGKGRPRARK